MKDKSEMDIRQTFVLKKTFPILPTPFDEEDVVYLIDQEYGRESDAMVSFKA